MSEIEKHFEIEGFRFRLILKSASIKAHSLMDSDGNKFDLKMHLNWMWNGHDGSDLEADIKRMIKQYREKHKS